MYDGIEDDLGYLTLSGCLWFIWGLGFVGLLVLGVILLFAFASAFLAPVWAPFVLLIVYLNRGKLREQEKAARELVLISLAGLLFSACIWGLAGLKLVFMANDVKFVCDQLTVQQDGRSISITNNSNYLISDLKIHLINGESNGAFGGIKPRSETHHIYNTIPTQLGIMHIVVITKNHTVEGPCIYQR